MPKTFAWLSIIIAWLIIPAAAQSSVTLAWEANPEPNIAGYRIHMGLTSGVYTTVQDVGNTTSYLVSNLAPYTTYYLALQAYNTSSRFSGLSSEIVIVTQSGGYPEWAAAGLLSGADAAANAIPHNDGVPNILKFAFNMNPAGPDTRVLQPGTGNAGLPFASVVQGATGPVFHLEFLRRKSGGLSYVPMVSTDLVSYQPMTGDTSVIEMDVDWERVIIEKPCDPAVPKLFATVRVTLP